MKGNGFALEDIVPTERAIDAMQTALSDPESTLADEGKHLLEAFINKQIQVSNRPSSSSKT